VKEDDIILQGSKNGGGRNHLEGRFFLTPWVGGERENKQLRRQEKWIGLLNILADYKEENGKYRN